MKIINFKSNAQITPQEIYKKLLRALKWRQEMKDKLELVHKGMVEIAIQLLMVSTIQLHEQEKELKQKFKELKNDMMLFSKETVQYLQLLQDLQHNLINYSSKFEEPISHED